MWKHKRHSAMPRIKAILTLDADRRPEQLAYVAERAQVLYGVGDQLWVSMSDDLAERFGRQQIGVQAQPDADLIELPAITFRPADGTPEPPPALRAPEPTGDQAAYDLVQFIGPALPEWVAAIADAGGEYVQEVPVF